MNPYPVISIIVPVYKTEKYIVRCLESLINQTFRNIEIICVNDGSPDDALAICEEYAKKDERIVLLSQTNQGLSVARNAGLLHARGKYIQFCDSDDYFDLAMCKKMHDAISLTAADIIVADVNVVYEDISSRHDGNWFKSPFRGLSPVTNETFRYINSCVWNKIYKKDLIDKFDISFPHGLHYEDISFVVKYLMVSKNIFGLGVSLYNYVRRSDSIMGITYNAKPDFAIDHVYVFRDVADFMERNGLRKKFEQAFIWMLLLYTSNACIYGGEKVNNKAFEAAAELLTDVDFNTIMIGYYNRDDIIRFYALKKGDRDLYFLIDKLNKEKFAQLFSKSFRTSLLIHTLRSCVLFPWYIYKTFCKVFNNPIPRHNIKLLLKAYLFFPYYVLKTYLALSM